MFLELKMVDHRQYFRPDWRPSITHKNLQLRAKLLEQTRAFFSMRKILEVETPLLGQYSVTDVNIDSFKVSGDGERYLQTSPEYAMKRLLANGSGDIYQICKSFRRGEQGKLHNSEFTLVEWYRLAYTQDQIIQETKEYIVELLKNTLDKINVSYISYDQAVLNSLGVTWSTISREELVQIAIDNGLLQASSLSVDQLHDFLFVKCVLPTFDQNDLVIVYHYPAAQAALAKLVDENKQIAQRFEIFFNGIELANGFVELTNADEQLLRFEKDQRIRRERSLSEVEIDDRLISALRFGFPNCAGVAVGFDRVVMLAANTESISEVLSFDWQSA